MPTVAFAIPIAPGKTDAFRSAHRAFAIDRRAEFEASRRRHGVAAERGFLQRTPAGDLAVVVFDVDDAGRFLAGLATSSDAFDADFRAYLLDTFGVDLARAPAGAPSELVFDWTSR